MVNEIAGEEGGRGNDRDDHAGNMPLPKIAANEIPASGYENRTDEIQGRIYCWQISHTHFPLPRCAFVQALIPA
jgi:hypothetical protein